MYSKCPLECPDLSFWYKYHGFAQQVPYISNLTKSISKITLLRNYTSIQLLAPTLIIYYKLFFFPFAFWSFLNTNEINTKWHLIDKRIMRLQNCVICLPLYSRKILKKVSSFLVNILHHRKSYGLKLLYATK